MSVTASSFSFPQQSRVGKRWEKNFTHVFFSSFYSVLNHPKLASAFSGYKFAETAPQYQAPKKDTPAKAPTPAAAPKEKAPKAPKPKAAAEDDDDEEPLVPAEPKAKNPLDDLPKSEFKLDDWKRTYSNEETADAIAWFYKK